MNHVVECVPNFSEGQRPEVVEAIAQAMTSAPEVYELDRHADMDHHRSVITIAGPPESIGLAAFLGVLAASQLIDLNVHRGVHPRLGAADVVPFVPIRGVTLEDCVRIARSTGERIARELGIPVYLYEAAAIRSDRTNLADARRGQFEGLRDEIGKNPGRHPDVGEARVHLTAGAVAIGARLPLIAYNIMLATNDVAIAKEIAKRVRHSSGGFPYVKAMGVMLESKNQAQVSMNLTNYKETPVELLYQTIAGEAAARGAAIAGSEIVGLIPQQALDLAPEFYHRAENFRGSVIEDRLNEAIRNRSGGIMGTVT